jgi:3-deoxy-D-manno-octulosonic-acid transferase
VWCAANTPEGEEIICLKTHIEVKKEFTNLLTIIIPRHINRVKNIKKICENLKLKSQILKDGSQIYKYFDVLIINSFGVLQKYYDYCDNVFIGKSMIKKLELVGGQNPIEAAKSSCRIYHGPFIYNFLEIYNLLESYNITEQVENANELKKSLIKNLKNKKIIDKIKIEQLNTYGNKILKNTVNELNYIIKK